MKKKAVLVTGATGFIGRYVVDHLLDNDLHVFVFTRNTGNNSLCFFKESKIDVVNGDITESLNIPKEVETIYHCAGIINRENEMWPVNVLGTRNVVEAAIKQNALLIHLSSAGVIGGTKKINIDENTECNPENLYEKTKFEAEQIVSKGIEKGLKARILRPTTVFGTGREPYKDSFLQLIRSILAGRYMNIRKGKGVYNIVYAGEVARAMLCMDNDNIPDGRIYFINTPLFFSDFAFIVKNCVDSKNNKIRNISHGTAIAIAALFTLLSAATGKKRGLTFSRLKALTDIRIFSQDRLVNETEYRPLCNVDEYLVKMCNEYRKMGLLLN